MKTDWARRLAAGFACLCLLCANAALGQKPAPKAAPGPLTLAVRARRRPGVAVMGIERISFGWYLRHIALWALLGYLAGGLVFVLQSA